MGLCSAPRVGHREHPLALVPVLGVQLVLERLAPRRLAARARAGRVARLRHEVSVYTRGIWSTRWYLGGGICCDTCAMKLRMTRWKMTPL